MKAPKCRLCGVVHWGSEPHVGVVGRVGRGRSPVDSESVVIAPGGRRTDREIVAAIRELLGEPVPKKPGFDRVAYQREYMRKRRAAAKGGDG